MSQEKPTGSPPKEDPVFPIWKMEEQIKEQLWRGVKTLGGAVVAVTVGSSTFTYIRRFDDELTVKYVDGCVVVTASAILTEEGAKVHNVSVYNICSSVDI